MLTPIASPKSDTLRVTEIYKSVQGESTWAGLPCTFVRLARCPLRCVWCDTAYSFHGGDTLTLDAIMDRCRELDCTLVELTGGEPLVQAGCNDLAAMLIAEGHTVLVETSGSLPIETLPPEAIRIMDLKCPDSGECSKNHWPNIEQLTERDEVKFVIASRLDFEWSRDIVRQYDLASRCRSVLFSAVFDRLAPKTLVDWILEENLPVRFQLQMHKFVWPPDQKGV